MSAIHYSAVSEPQVLTLQRESSDLVIQREPSDVIQREASLPQCWADDTDDNLNALCAEAPRPPSPPPPEGKLAPEYALVEGTAMDGQYVCGQCQQVYMCERGCGAELCYNCRFDFMQSEYQYPYVESHAFSGLSDPPMALAVHQSQLHQPQLGMMLPAAVPVVSGFHPSMPPPQAMAQAPYMGQGPYMAQGHYMAPAAAPMLPLPAHMVQQYVQPTTRSLVPGLADCAIMPLAQEGAEA